MTAAPLSAGVRMKGEATDLKSGDVMHQDVLLDADRMRVNVKSKSADVSMIFLDGSSESKMIILDNTKNDFRVLDQKTMQELQQKMQGAMSMMQERMKNMTPEQRAMMEKMMGGRMAQMTGQGAQAKTIYTSKGGSTVNGFKCTQYEGTSNNQKVAELCAAEPSQLGISAGDIQVFEKMRQFFAEFSRSFANLPFASGAMSQLMDPGFQGYPVQHATFREGQAVYKAETKLVDRASFSDADFSTGSARRVEMPMGPPSRQP